MIGLGVDLTVHHLLSLQTMFQHEGNTTADMHVHTVTIPNFTTILFSVYIVQLICYILFSTSVNGTTPSWLVYALLL